MKTKITEFRNLTPEELLDKVQKFKKDLMLLRFQKKTGKLERQTAVSEMRRDIARALTIAREKQLEEKIQRKK